jgi:hypothetical protein
MNERIRELARQAGMVKILEEHAHEYGNGMFENTPYPELEKFAELIVAECAEVAKDFVTTANNKLVEKIHIFPWSLQDKIKEHFGVEE